METVGYVSVMLILLSRTCPVSCSDVVSDGDRIDDMEDDMLVMKMDINRIEEKILTDKISRRRELRQQIWKQVRAAMSEMLQDGSLKDMMSGQLQMRQMKHNYHQMKRQLIHVTKSFRDFRDETSVFKEAILKGDNSSTSACKDMARLEMELKQQNVDIEHMKAESKHLTRELAQIKADRESRNCTLNNADTSTSMPQIMSTQQPSRNECTKMAVPNFSFETTGNWLNTGVGWTSDDTQAQDGGRSAKVTSGGAYQEVRKFIISGYSKNVGGRNSITTPSDYSLYCDLKKPSGSFLWGHIATFTPGRSTWHRVQVNVSLSKADAVVMARCHLLYRNSASVGAAYFDNVSLYRLSDDVTDFTQCQIDMLQVSPQPSSSECTKMAVPNFSFETTGNWFNYGVGWTPDDTQAQDGGRSAKVTSGGAYQEFVFPSPVRKFIISGYSKNVGGRNSITTPSDYSLYCDLKKPSGSFLWGHIATFTPGRSTWHRVQVNVSLSKADAVVMARCHLLYRNSASVGAAYFDNVSLYRLSDDVTDFTQCQIDMLQVSPQPSSSECTKMAVPNFSFETTGNWFNYGVGWTPDDTQAQDGGRSAKVTSGGAYQEFVFPSPVRKFIISGYSKNVGGRNSITTPSDYSLYCDLKKPSGSFLWGHIATFTPGRSTWHRVQVNVSLSKADAVVMARCHLLYRNSASVGAAYFDNVSLYRLSDDVTDFTQCQIDMLQVSPQPSSSECTKMAVPNFSFETTGNWFNYGVGWTPDDTQAQDGGRSAKVTSGGAYQEFVFPSPVRKFIISGYSKNVGGRSSITTPSDYSLYCDLKKPSGSFLWGHIATFTPGRSTWHRVQVNVSLSKTDAVVKARCYLLYRNSASVGAAYFDNVSLYRLPDDVTDFTKCQMNK